jgi:hypothetical protein
MRKAIAAVAIGAMALVGCSTPMIDSGYVADQIEDWAESVANLAPGSTYAFCPAEQPMEAGHEFLCTISDFTGDYYVQVEVLNDSGDVVWQIIGPVTDNA